MRCFTLPRAAGRGRRAAGGRARVGRSSADRGARRIARTPSTRDARSPRCTGRMEHPAAAQGAANLARASHPPIVRADFGLPHTGFSHGSRRRKEERREEGGARLFGRARHVDHPQVAADDLWLRGRHLHGRSRPGRRAGAGAAQGADARHQVAEYFHRGFARRVRARLRVPDVPRQCAVRGPISARHLDRAAADRQAADRDRRKGRRRRGGARRDRQGQRPGALRADLLRAQARREGDRAVARMGFSLARSAARIRREKPDPDRQGQARRSAVFGRRQPAARVVGRKGAGGPFEGSAGLRLFAHGQSRGGARQPDLHHHRLREGRRGCGQRQDDVAGRAARRISTRTGGVMASAGSIWSRTVSSA